MNTRQEREGRVSCVVEETRVVGYISISGCSDITALLAVQVPTGQGGEVACSEHKNHQADSLFSRHDREH